MSKGADFMYDKELYVALEAGKEASKAIVNFYKKGFNVEIKEDNSPVTEADKASNNIICTYLKDHFPSYAILTEEEKDDLSRLNSEYVWIIDPLDGTEDFIKKDDEFTVNVALCRNHEIVVGIIYVPVTGVCYCAVKGEGALKIDGDKVQKINVSSKTSDITCLTSVYHLQRPEIEAIERHSDIITKVEKKGSSLKGCLIAEGKAEISYRLSKGTKEWDTAAFDLIVREAGGYVLKPDGNRMKYNRENVYNDEGYIICNNLNNFLL